MLKKLTTTALLTCTLTALAGTTQQIPFTSNKTPIIVAQNQTFDILLPSNATTGFSWKVAHYDKFLITFVSHKYIAPQNNKLVGAPGYEDWVFQANKGDYRVNQVGHIVMEYARPWETKDATTTTFVVIVKKSQ